MKKIFNYLIDSFTTSKGGFSGRKLSAFAAIVISAMLSLRYCSEAVVVELCIVWLSFAAVCLGIVTVEQIIKLKNGNKTDNNTNENG